ncbi:HAD family hydrolase [Prochlorothrix hollandica]|uniref:Haloacid dehalogenase n=1 Tax=Prochlorothrix hollandica PCC 9006 = CALU 1027 TaxID=317619 RepID=A0A0M2PWE1_PROHO|nr:HAD family hydrolase [Prochlorothrix hollandica]KKI98691.1 hypothetical protein PROH_17745 [Prochlorothrix hollandica PCC 9006 = CALU 1027]
MSHPSSSVPGPTLLALDFDGVICDGLREYFHSAWLAHGQYWEQPLGPGSDRPDADRPDADRPDLDRPDPDRQTIEARFYRLRPVIETGWEMPVLIQALLQGVEDEAILTDWAGQSAQIVAADHLDPKAMATTLDNLRDRQIQGDLDTWLGLHQFYPGVISRLQALLQQEFPWVIVTTKEGRFVHQLLGQAGLTLPRDRIFGKEVQQPKVKTLQHLAQDLAIGSTIWFVEDRLPTLVTVREQFEENPNPEPSSPQVSVQLFLADWGYNTHRDRQQVIQEPQIHPLSLGQFNQPFSQWLG